MGSLIPTNTKLPAHLARRAAESSLSASLSGGLGSGSSYPRITLKTGRFRIKEGDTETIVQENYLDVIIIGANPNVNKLWYAEKWAPDADNSGPACFSNDGIRPDQSSADPQNDVCVSCPHNQFGSLVTDNGQKLKACSDQKRLAVVDADNPDGPIYMLAVTPTSLKNLNKYSQELSQRGIPPECVVTRVSADLNVSFSKLVFGFHSFVDEQVFAVVEERLDSDEVREITGEKPQIAHVEKAKEAKKPNLVRAAEPEIEDAQFDEEEPAPKAKGFGAKKDAPAKSGFGAKAKEAAAPTTKQTKEPAAAPVAKVASLTDRIQGLLGDDEDEDA